MNEQNTAAEDVPNRSPVTDGAPKITVQPPKHIVATIR